MRTPSGSVGSASVGISVSCYIILYDEGQYSATVSMPYSVMSIALFTVRSDASLRSSTRFCQKRPSFACEKRVPTATRCSLSVQRP